MTCTGLSVPVIGAVQPCCTGPNNDKCGIDSSILGVPGCFETNQPGNPDDSCTLNGTGGAAGTGGASGTAGAGATDSGAPDSSGGDSGPSDSGTPDAADSGGGQGGSGGAGSGGRGAGGFGGGFPAPQGCCKPSGVCGVQLNFPPFLELGCVELPAADGAAPQTCTPSGS